MKKLCLISLLLAVAVLTSACVGASIPAAPSAEANDPTATTELLDPDLAPFCSLLGEDVLRAFLSAAAEKKLEPAEAMRSFCAPYEDFGDGAAYTLLEGSLEGETYTLQAARLHENYDPGAGTLAERAQAQTQRYAELGNQLGILGPEAAEGEPLTLRVTGLTVYDPTGTAELVAVSVNGGAEERFALKDAPCDLLELNTEPLPADRPVTVVLRVLQTRGDAPVPAELRVWLGLESNISAAR